MSALIGALRVSLSAETAQFEAGMKRAQRTAAQTRSSFQKSFGGLAGIVKGGLAGLVSGLSIGLITQGVKAALDYAGSLGEVAQQLGVTTRELQVFRFAVQQNGGTAEQADMALGKFAISISKARSGSEQAAKAFAAAGVSLADLETKSKTELLGQVADKFKATGGAAANAASGVVLFGKNFLKVVPTLDLGSKGFNEVAAAADRLGIILDDDLINSSDEASDTLDALATVLKAQVSVAVAESADEILGMANSISELIGQLSTVLGYLKAFRSAVANFEQNFNLPNLFGKNRAFGMNTPGSSVTVDLTTVPRKRKAASSGGGSPERFLAGGGGGRKRSGGADDAERKRQEALRNAYQFDRDILRAQQDTLRAQQSLATDYSERAALSIQMLNLEQQGFQREMEYAVASGDLTKAQAAQLEAEYAKKDALERQAVIAEEEVERAEGYNRLEILDLELQRDILASQERLADTASEQRDVRLRLLDLDYRIERARLEQVLADEKASYAAKEEARRRLAALSKTQGNDRQGVIRDTAGPFEQAQMQFGDLSEEMENLRVNGIMAAGDALATLATEGFGSFKDAAISAIKAVIAEFIRLQMIKMMFSLFSSGSGAADVGFGPGSSGIATPGFATGGSFSVLGKGGMDNNLLSLNGLPIARVSHGERVSISNDNGPSGGGGMNMTLNFTGPVSRETMMQAGAKVRAAVASANRKGA